MLESRDNRAGSEKRNGNIFRRHAEWPPLATPDLLTHFGSF